MNYYRIYDNLIQRALARTLIGYSERHHIIPKCIGGTDDKENIVVLTAREHFVAHLLLVKMYPHEHKLAFAANMMTIGGKNHARNNRTFGWLRERYSIARKSITRAPPTYTKPRKVRKKETKPRNRDYTMSDEQKLKISISGKARNYKHSEATKARIREGNKSTKALQTVESKYKGHVWINNGVKQQRIIPSVPLPFGFNYGRLPRLR